MKVLIVSAYPPEPVPEADHGLHICENLAESGHDVHVLCRKGSIGATRQNIMVHSVMEGWSWADLPRFVQCLKDCGPDAVFLIYIGFVFDHQPMITFLPTICKKILPGVPCVTQFENVVWDIPRRSFLERLVLKAIEFGAGGKDVHRMLGTLLRDSSRIIALSSVHRDCLVSHYPKAGEKILVLPPPPLMRLCTDVPAVARKRARKAIGVAESDFVWIYCGYIYRGKGLETLLGAFKIASRRDANLRLVIVGGQLEIPNFSDSDYFQMVRGLSETLGIADKVIFTGSYDWDSEEGSLYLYAGDVCVLPFDCGVTLSNSSLAAASVHGLPVLSTKLWEGRDEMLEHGRNIYLVEPYNPEIMAEAMEILRESSALRERLQEGIFELSQKWHRWDTMIARLIGILESAISDRKESGKGNPDAK